MPVIYTFKKIDEVQMKGHLRRLSPELDWEFQEGDFMYEILKDRFVVGILHTREELINSSKSSLYIERLDVFHKGTGEGTKIIDQLKKVFQEIVVMTTPNSEGFWKKNDFDDSYGLDNHLTWNPVQ